jgi:citronellol/citronellal dehydrogenase
MSNTTDNKDNSGVYTSHFNSIFRPSLFAERTHIITGGGTGIGRATAHELAALGAQTILIGRREAPLSSTATEITESGGTAHFYTCDIREETAVNDLIAQIIADHGEIHGLVNNAGGQFPAPLAQMNQKGFETVVRTNLVGGFLLSKAVFTQSMRKSGGAIVNIIADMWRGMPGMGHSGAARAGMENLTRTAAVEWASSGVRVNAVAPGWIASSGLDRYSGPVTQLIPKLKDHLPLGRLGTEAEISACICFLLSPAAAFVTGATLRVDGGAPLGNPLFPHITPKNQYAWNGFHLASTPKILENT